MKAFVDRERDAAHAALYAKYRDARALYRPAECRADSRRCWVREGPPAITGHTECIGCGGSPPGFRRTGGRATHSR